MEQNLCCRISSKGEKMKVISIIGGDSQVGTTMIAQSLGESLAFYGKKVILLLASGNYGNDFLKQGAYSIDNLGGKNETENNANEIREVIEYTGELAFIGGIKKIQELPFFSIKFVGKIAKELQNDFDFMIVDGGSNINSPLMISSLLFADVRFTVLTQHEKSVKRYRNIRELLLEPKNLKGKIILNKYAEVEGLYTKEHVEFLLSEYVSVGFSNRPEGAEKENERETLMSDEIFAQEMNALRDIVLNEKETSRVRELNKVKERGDYYEKAGEPTRVKRRVFFR